MNKKIYYLYRHVDLTRRVPFYIGVGTVYQNKKTYKRIYDRAFQDKPRQRNRYWIDLVKTTDYKVEILLHSESEDYIYEKEIEFISLYGRAALNEGTLVNISKGGRGGQWGSGITKSGTRSIVFTYNRQGKFFKKFETYKDCARHFGATIGMISDQVGGRGTNMSYKGHLFFTEDHGEFFWDYERYFEVIIRPGDSSKRGVSYLDSDMNLIKHFESQLEGALFYGISRYLVQDNSDCGRPDSKGNYWRKDGETREFHEFDVMGCRRRGGPPEEPVYVYKIDTGEFLKKYDSTHEASRETNCSRPNISLIMRKKSNLRTVHGLTFFSEYQGENVGKVRFGKTKRVGKFDKGVLIEEFESAIEAGEKYNLSPKSIRGYCGNQKRSGSLTAKWRFLD